MSLLTTHNSLDRDPLLLRIDAVDEIFVTEVE